MGDGILIHFYVLLTGTPHDRVVYFDDEKTQIPNGRYLDWVKGLARMEKAEMFVYDGILYGFNHDNGKWYQSRWEGADVL